MGSKIFVPCNVYIGLWTLYRLSGFLYSNDWISRIVLAIFILMSLYYAYIANMAYKVDNYIRILNLLLVVFSIYGFEFIFSGRVIYMDELIGRQIRNTNYLINIYTSLLPIYPFFVFTKQGYLTEKKLIKYTVYFFLIAIVLYYYIQTKVVFKFQREEVTSSAGYLILGLFPLLCFWNKKKILMYSLLGIIIVLVLLSMKRGAILTLAISLIYFVYSSLRESTPRDRYIIMTLSIVAIIGTAWYVNYLLDTSAYFRLRIDETLAGSSSGRDVIYSNLLNYLLHQSDPFFLLFGQGANATVEVTGAYAHNDWFEIVINQGLFGVLIYMAYFYSFLLYWRNTHRQKEIHQVVGLLFIICFVPTLFSMSYDNMSFFACCAWGYCLGQENVIERY